MSDESKNKGSGVMMTVFGTILTITVIFLCSTASLLYALHGRLSEVAQETRANTENVKEIQRSGSPAVQAINARLDELTRGQARIEQSLKEHMNPGRIP